MRLARHWERTAILLGMCLPVPLLAVTGLSIPLPGTVERIAAALVPWTHSASLAENDALPTGTNGSIIRLLDETREPVPLPVAASNPRPYSTASPAEHGGGGTGGDQGGGGDTPAGSGGSSGGGGGGGGGGQPPGGGEPTPTSPIEGVVGGVTGTVDPVVDGVTDPVTDVVGSTGLEETVDGLLPGLGG